MLRIDYDLKSGPVIVIFCSSLKPEFYANTKDFSRVFLYDTEGLWFQKEIDKIRRFLDSIQSKTMAMGVSRGGYAALLFGHLYGLRTLTFSPQTSLFDDRWTEIKEARKASKYPEFFDLSFIEDRNTVYFCKDNPKDAEHVSRIRAEIHLVEGKQHNSASVLKSQGKLGDVIHNFTQSE